MLLEVLGNELLEHSNSLPFCTASGSDWAARAVHKTTTSTGGQSTATGQQSPASPPISHPREFILDCSNPAPTHHHAFVAINTKTPSIRVAADTDTSSKLMKLHLCLLDSSLFNPVFPPLASPKGRVDTVLRACCLQVLRPIFQRATSKSLLNRRVIQT